MRSVMLFLLIWWHHMVYTKARSLGALYGIRNGCYNILDKFTSKFKIFFALKAETAEQKKKVSHALFNLSPCFGSCRLLMDLFLFRLKVEPSFICKSFSRIVQYLPGMPSTPVPGMLLLCPLPDSLFMKLLSAVERIRCRRRLGTLSR